MEEPPSWEKLDARGRSDFVRSLGADAGSARAITHVDEANGPLRDIYYYRAQHPNEAVPENLGEPLLNAVEGIVSSCVKSSMEEFLYRNQ